MNLDPNPALSIYYVNLGKVSFHSMEFQSVLKQIFQLDPDIIVFIEHPFGEKKTRPYVDGFLFTFSQYVAVCYKCNLNAVRIPFQEDFQKYIELVLIENTVIGGIYFHPLEDPLPLLNEATKAFGDLEAKRWIIATDTNASHPAWDFSEKEASAHKLVRGEKIFGWVEEHQGMVHNQYTSYGSYIDVMQTPSKEYYIDALFSHRDIQCSTCDLLEDLRAKDHRPIFARFLLPLMSKKKLYRTHWNHFRSLIGKSSSLVLRDPRTDFDDWYTNLLAANNAARKEVKITPKTPLWWTDTYLTKLAHLKRLKNRARKNRRNEQKQTEFREYRENFCKFSKALRGRYFRLLLADLRWSSPHSISKKSNFLKVRRKTVRIPNMLVGPDGLRVNVEKTSETLLDTYFLSDPGVENEIQSPEFQQMENFLLTHSEKLRSLRPRICLQEFELTLRRIKNRSAPGEDGLSKRHFVNLDSASRTVLLEWYNTVLDTGIIPVTWKRSKVVFIPKAGKNQAIITNLRPISLNNIIFRIFDKILSHRIAHILDREKILFPEQHGFCRQKSIDTYFMQLFDRIDQLKCKNKKVGLVAIDFAKAFDRVHVPFSLRKLFSLLPQDSALLAYFPLLLNYVETRVATTTFAAYEGMKAVDRGIPQGGSISPHLFNLIMFVFLSEIKNRDLQFEVFVFADDILLLVSGCSYEGIETIIQRDLPTLQTVAEENFLTINYEKSQYMRYVNDKRYLRYDPLSLSNGSMLPSVQEVKVLGVTLVGNSLSKHLDLIVRKATAQTHHLMQYGKIRNGLRAKFMLTLFHALCVAHFTWSTVPNMRAMNHEKIEKLSVLQAKMSRTILHLRKNAPRIPSIALTFRFSLADIIATQFLLVVLFNPFNRVIFDLRTRSGGLRNRTHSIPSIVNRITSNWRIDALVPHTRCCTKSLRPPSTFSLITVEILKKPAAIERAQSPFWTSFVAFTDGSYLQHTDKAAWSFLLYHRGEILYQSTGHALWTSSIFWAETRAIYEVLEYLALKNISSCDIFVDSIGAMLAYSGPNTTSYEVAKGWEIIEKYKISVRFHWCPAHVGVEGNEKADELARVCAMISPPPEIRFSRNAFRSLLRLRAMDNILEAWRTVQPKSVIHSRRALRLYFRRYFAHPFYVQIAANSSQFRAELHYVNPHVSQYCTCTDLDSPFRSIENLYHVLIVCPHHDWARKKLFNAIGTPTHTTFLNFVRNIFQDEFQFQALIHFFESTRVLHFNRLREILRQY